MAETTAPSNLIETIRQWPRKRQLSLAATILVCIVFFAGIILQANKADYQLLFGNLDSADASAVVDRLKEQKVPYRLENGGRAIFIPADQVYETRLAMAGSGLPNGGGVGFEIFDKQSFGMTDFAQKINYLRALQGELARTIASLAPVEAARVHLALPEKRLFRDQQQKASASVIVKLAAGQSLHEGQILGIVNLVSGSVDGLDSEQVAVIDDNGRVLSKTRDHTAGTGTAPDMLEYQKNLEQSLELRAQALLDRALGMGNSMVQVTAVIDYTQRERMEESYDPNTTAVRSEQSSTEKGGITGTGGVPGVQSNIKDEQGGSSFIPTSRTNETINYEISKVVSKQVDPVGTLKNISVAVLVADRLVENSEDSAPTTEPRDAKELAAIEKMVSRALGINPTRGDQIAVISRPFETAFSTEPLVKASPWSRIYQMIPMIKYALLCLAVGLLYFLIIRPLLQVLRGEGRMVEHYKTVEQLESEMAGLPHGGAKQEAPLSLPGGAQTQQNDPAQVIKAWLKDN
ncbi:MAG: flagellar basal-body MS-ring/collar protein FliF [Pedobacter sp.]